MTKTMTGTLVCEASMLGFGPGQWPHSILFEGKQYTKYQPIFHGAGEDRELAGVSYRQVKSGQLLTVLND